MRASVLLIVVIGCGNARTPTAPNPAVEPAPAVEPTPDAEPPPPVMHEPAVDAGAAPRRRRRNLHHCKPGTCFYPGEGCIVPASTTDRHGTGRCSSCNDDGECESSR